MKFECAGKLILLGEYSVITGGPALVAAIPPFFSVTVSGGVKGVVHPFHKDSPAGLLVSDFTKKYSDLSCKLEWSDPYKTPIGVGSSSAQFVLVYRALCAKLKIPEPSTEKLLLKYWAIVGSTQGIRPSGVDVVSQFMGGVTYFRNEPFLAEKIRLPSWDAEFILAFTGSKMKTHEHLMKLQARGFPGAFQNMLSRLNDLTARGLDAWKASDAEAFGRCMGFYQDAMNTENLSDEPVIEKITRGRHMAGVLGCKGSGAQGGDSALFLVEKNRVASVSEEIKKQLGWEVFNVSLS